MADARAMPPVDDSQDFTLLGAVETSTHTVLKFKRPLVARESRDLTIQVCVKLVLFGGGVALQVSLKTFAFSDISIFLYVRE